MPDAVADGLDSAAAVAARLGTTGYLADDELATVVEDRTAAVALNDRRVGLDHALAADVLLESRDATGRDRGLVPRGAAQQLVRCDDSRKSDDEEGLPQVEVRAVSGEADHRQFLVFDLENGHVPAVLLTRRGRRIRGAGNDHVGGRTVELHGGRVAVAVRQVDVQRPLDN